MSDLLIVEDKIINKHKIIDIEFIEKVFYQKSEDFCLSFEPVNTTKILIKFYKKGLEETEYKQGRVFFSKKNGHPFELAEIDTIYSLDIERELYEELNSFLMDIEYENFEKYGKFINTIHEGAWCYAVDELKKLLLKKGFVKKVLYGANVYLDPVKSIETEYCYDETNYIDKTTGSITTTGFFGNKIQRINTRTEHSGHILKNKNSTYNYLYIQLKTKYSSKEEILNLFK